MKIYNLGSLNIDYVYNVEHFVSAGETLSSDKLNIFPGGKGLNQSVALSRAGANVIHGALIGDGGDLLINTLKDSGVDISRINKTNGSCGHAIIQVDKTGQNCILLFGGTNLLITEDYIEEFLFDAQENDILVLQNEVNNLEKIFEIANKKKMQIALNPSPIKGNISNLPLNYVKWWFCNEIEAAELFGSEEIEDITNNFRDKYPESNLILTLGKNGSMFINSDICIKQPIFEVDVVDTTAAGDTFSGYFIASIIKGETPEKALKIASLASSVTVSRAGAASSIPYFNDIITKI